MIEVKEFLLSQEVQGVTRFALYVLLAPGLYMQCAADIERALGRSVTMALGRLLAGYCLGFAVVHFAQSQRTLFDLTTLLCLSGLSALLQLQASRFTSQRT